MNEIRTAILLSVSKFPLRQIGPIRLIGCHIVFYHSTKKLICRKQRRTEILSARGDVGQSLLLLIFDQGVEGRYIKLFFHFFGVVIRYR